MTGPKKNRLGKGLGALIEDYMDPPPSPTGGGSSLSVRSIVANPNQPRRVFDAPELAELASSIHENGLLQPLLVRPFPGSPGRFQLVAGERRLRAIRSLGWDDVPVIIRDIDDDVLLVLALVENLQREALNPIEEAEGYRALSDQHGLTQGEIAKSVGKNRTTVTNMLRLLQLPPSVRQLVEGGALTMGHARALLSLDDPVRMGDLADQAVRAGWSVREMERRTKTTPQAPRPTSSKSPIFLALEEEIRAALGTKVLIRANKKGSKGVIEVPFHSAEEFERIFALVVGKEVTEIVG